ncbi:hypothetical protein GOP47_0005180 [Adiantum capillus-veneris]|uniref:Uncharacterized protein n=1 Tax=Adiantum capillus-veneris TaxID=13818 RepID=A0A9D4V5I6_ADICA|nr:hypothetical protein GOP47_0005180 [Adiantum capillus-veneris]
MQHRSSPSPPSKDLAFVPFAWEDKPGVPKQQESSSTLLQYVSIHIPAEALQHPNSYPPAILPCPLSKPPRLQPLYGATALRNTPSFGPITSPPPPRHHSGLLVRKQSFDSIVYGDGGRPLTRKYSHGSLPGHQKRTMRGRKEDDPFFMAIQTCRKEPIRVFGLLLTKANGIIQA